MYVVYTLQPPLKPQINVSGATHAVYDNMPTQANGYVVYGFDDSTIRVWADSKGRKCTCTSFR